MKVAIQPKNVSTLFSICIIFMCISKRLTLKSHHILLVLLAVRSVSICVREWPQRFGNLANHSLPITKRLRSFANKTAYWTHCRFQLPPWHATRCFSCHEYDTERGLKLIIINVFVVKWSNLTLFTKITGSCPFSA